MSSNYLYKMNFSLTSLIMLMLLFQGAVVQSHAAPPRQGPNPTPLTALEGIPTDEWAVELVPGADPDAVAAQYGFQNLGPVGTLENFYLFRRPAGGVSTADIQGLENEAKVLWSEQQVARQQQPKIIPSDPLYGSQWHLKNTGQSGGTANQDVNIVPVWNNNITGDGVTVAVVDDGLQYTHPDFSGKYISSASYDFNGTDNNPAPNVAFDFHGTAAAGVAVAGNEGTCGVGSALGADVSGLRLIAAPSTDAQEATALTYQYQVNDIYSNSWGPTDNGQILVGPGTLTLAALQNGVTNGRGGRGNIYVWAAGNGLAANDNVNYDGYANSRFTIAVAAVDHDGRQSWYSEPGAPIVVTAPSSGDVEGITTTDLLGSNGYSGNNCTSTFGGTSSATPLVSGIIALMLEANPNLGWRDVQHILIETAVKNDLSDSDWKTNGAGYPINHKYGFGRIDASAAVNLAQSWTNKPHPAGFNSGVINVNQAIPNFSSTGITSNFVVNQNIKLEHVEVLLQATHPARGNLKVVLTSPAGTQSVLAEVHPDTGDNYNNWRFMSVRHWGESSQGTWSLKVTDETGQEVGTFNSWRLIFPGPPSTPALKYTYLPFLRKSPPVSGGGFVNGDFESGQNVGWTEYSSNGENIVRPWTNAVPAHSGSWFAWLGYVPDEISYIRQQVTVPPSTPYLTYWHWIVSADGCDYDFAFILVNNTVVNEYDLCSSTNTGGWIRRSVNLSAYAGQNVSIQIRAETDFIYESSLFVDDVSFQSNAASLEVVDIGTTYEPDQLVKPRHPSGSPQDEEVERLSPLQIDRPRSED